MMTSVALHMALSAIARYGLAIASFVVALGAALLVQPFGYHNVELPLFLFGVAVTGWYAGPGPCTLALLLSIAFFDFFFTEPRYSFSIGASDIPQFIVFVAFASITAWFSTVRRRVEREVRQA
jgi:two-component system, OmpR family, sensor histidine kinase KdpD